MVKKTSPKTSSPRRSGVHRIAWPPRNAVARKRVSGCFAPRSISLQKKGLQRRPWKTSRKPRTSARALFSTTFRAKTTSFWLLARCSSRSWIQRSRKPGEADEPMPQFLRSLGVRMTQEPIRNPGIIRALLQAYLSTTPVREAMLDLQKRVHALHTEIVRMGQERGEIRKDLPAADIAHVFRQTIFGTLLFWSLHGDATLHPRMESAFNVLWSGLAPREANDTHAEPALAAVPLFTCGD